MITATIIIINNREKMVVFVFFSLSLSFFHLFTKYSDEFVMHMNYMYMCR